ncbi:MAG: hypothetical protein IKB30_04285 [Clostridia bacterium]|nr:hypothetical protein [Clostridia bacterium]
MNENIKNILYSETSDVDKEIKDIEYKQYESTLRRIETEFINKLNPELKKLYIDCSDAYNNVKIKESEIFFIRGFKCGVRMIIEVFTEE